MPVQMCYFLYYILAHFIISNAIMHTRCMPLYTCYYFIWSGNVWYELYLRVPSLTDGVSHVYLYLVSSNSPYTIHIYIYAHAETLIVENHLIN